jgi:hypothetical protein
MAHGCKHAIRGDAGAVYVEFLLVILPFLLMFLGLTHLGLLYSAHLLVSHAAAKAVRAAVVILPDEHGFYDDVEPNRIGDGGGGLDAYAEASESGRLAAIRKAAWYALAPLSPGDYFQARESLADALGDHPGRSTVVQVLSPMSWAAFATAVTFPDDDEGYLTQFPSQGYVKVRVTFLYKCSVPVIRELVCHTWSELEPRAKRELETAGIQTLMKAGSNYVAWRFAVITAERTMPNQGR